MKNFFALFFFCIKKLENFVIEIQVENKNRLQSKKFYKKIIKSNRQIF